MRCSASHRMPPAKKSSPQRANKNISIFSKYSVYAGFYVLWAAHIECRQRHIHMSSFCCTISVFCSRMVTKTYKHVIILFQHICFFKKHGLKDCISWLYHTANLYIQSHERTSCPFCLVYVHVWFPSARCPLWGRSGVENPGVQHFVIFLTFLVIWSCFFLSFLNTTCYVSVICFAFSLSCVFVCFIIPKPHL